MKIKIAIILSLLVLTGCEEKKVVKNKDFYLENTQERKDMIDYCKKNNIDHKVDLNCYNSQQAEDTLRRQNTKEVKFELDLLK